MRSFSHDKINRAAIGLERGIFLKPLIKRFLIYAEKIRRYEPGRRACHYGKISHPAVKRLIRVIRSLNREVERRILPELFNYRLNISHCFKSVVKSLCSGKHSFLVSGKSLYHLFRLSVILVERRLILIYHGQVPFVLCLNVFSFKCHNKKSPL